MEVGRPKPAKVPFDPQTGNNIDPHDPRNWMTYEQARSTGHLVGFVLTESDPYFFLDLDNCRDGDGWNAAASAMFHQFPGAAAEISISMQGLHIIGRADHTRLTDRRNKWSGWLEFYTHGRFIALGHGFTGNQDTDWTETLLRVVPRREIDAAGALPDGPVPEYTGPSDDNELLALAMRAAGSMASQFGQKASFKDLWTGDAAHLVQWFPSPSGDAFDRSSADAALMTHLAFWTGKDAARMDRMFRASALYRPDKYGAREDYRNSTIRGAIAAAKKVYDRVISSVQQGMATDSETVIVNEFLTIGEQIDWFKGCIYIRDIHRVLIPGGATLKPEQFNVQYGGKQFSLSGDSRKNTDRAFEAFTQNRVYQFPKAISTCFRPNQPSGVIINDMANVYFPETIVAISGDVSPFLDLLKRMIPNEIDRLILLNWAAALVQYPGEKFQWAPVIQGVPGNGKTFIAKCLQYAVGQRYTHSPAAEDLGNQFNSYIENKLLITVEEVHLQGKRELLDTLKPLITNDRVEVQAKGVDKRMIDNPANWFFCTNHKDAILKTKGERRYAVIFTAQQNPDDLIRDQMDGSYFPSLWNWARGGGFAHITHFLKNMELTAQFNPALEHGGLAKNAPETSSLVDAITISLGRAEQEIMECVDSEDMGFRGGWISTVRVEQLFKEKNIRMSRTKIADMLESLGYRSTGRAARNIMAEDLKRPVLYIRRALYQSGIGVDEYCAAQGYGADYRHAIRVVR